MKVKMIRSLATGDHAYSAGQIIELDDKLAASWINSEVCIAETPQQVTDIVKNHPTNNKRTPVSGRNKKLAEN